MIRKAEIGDIEYIGALLTQVCAVHRRGRPDLFTTGRKYSDEQLKKMIGEGVSPIFVYEQGGKVLGYVFCELEEYDGSGAFVAHKTLYIDDLCVDENYRGNGIGKALFDYAVDYAKSCGVYNVTLNVWEQNKSAIAFYKKIGLSPYKTGMEYIIK